MKHFLLLSFFLSFFLFSPSSFAQTQGTNAPPVNREVSSMWKNNDLSLFGYHKPYTTLKVFDGTKQVGETMTDSLGKFEITVKGLDPAAGHAISIKGYDRYGRELADGSAVNSNQTAVTNVLNIPVNPGVVYQGQLTDQTSKEGLANATINIYDKKTNALLSQTQSDSQGNFAFTGVPRDSYMVVEKDGYGLTKQEITGENFNVEVSQTGNYKPPVNPNKNTGTVAEKIVNSGEESNPMLTYIIIFAVVAVLIGVVFVGLKLKKDSSVK